MGRTTTIVRVDKETHARFKKLSSDSEMTIAGYLRTVSRELSGELPPAITPGGKELQSLFDRLKAFDWDMPLIVMGKLEQLSRDNPEIKRWSCYEKDDSGHWHYNPNLVEDLDKKLEDNKRQGKKPDMAAFKEMARKFKNSS